MLLETLRASAYFKGFGLWLMSGVSLPRAASSLQLIPAINPVSPSFLGRYPGIADHAARAGRSISVKLALHGHAVSELIECTLQL